MAPGGEEISHSYLLGPAQAWALVLQQRHPSLQEGHFHSQRAEKHW